MGGREGKGGQWGGGRLRLTRWGEGGEEGVRGGPTAPTSGGLGLSPPKHYILATSLVGLNRLLVKSTIYWPTFVYMTQWWAPKVRGPSGAARPARPVWPPLDTIQTQ